IYTPLFQVESGATMRAVFVMRTSLGDPEALASAVRGAIWSVDPEVPVLDVRTMGAVVERSLSARRFAAARLSAFAPPAVVLAAVGLYGVLSYAVTRRAPELGVRSALGAAPADLIRLVLGEALRLTLAGLAVGAAAGVAAGRAMGSLLFGIGAFDAAALASAAA